MWRSRVGLISIVAALSCAGGDPVPAVPQASAASIARLDALLAELSTLRGSLDSSWTFTGERSVFTALAALGDSGTIADTAVARLVSCLGQPDSAAVTYGVRKVRLAVVCYTVLKGLAYHEQSYTTVAVVPDWPGHLPRPDATDAQLRAAHRVWLRVVKDRAYHFL
jgi:hypothetical protein